MATKEELEKFAGNIKAAAIEFNVSERTIRRWLKSVGLYQPQTKYNPGKINAQQIKEICYLYNALDLTQQEIANKYKISQAMVGRIINAENKNSLSFKGEAIASVKSLNFK